MAERPTVFALATPDVPGPRAVVRISGNAAIHAARAVAPGGRRLELPGGQLPCEIWTFSAPASATGEDVAEIHLPGSPALVAALSARLIDAGCEPAPAGEFTRRAYLNSKLDLAAAEAVMMLVASGDAAGARRAQAALTGALAAKVRALAGELEALCARIELSFDFDDDSVAAGGVNLAAEARRLAGGLRALCGPDLPSQIGLPRVVLCGPTNAGKSTLFNALVGQRRAAVSPEPGTTRDCVSAEVPGAGFVLIDTAGFKEARGEIEGTALAHGDDAAKSADLVVVVIDAAGTSAIEAAHAVAAMNIDPQQLLVVRSKADLICTSGGTVELPPPLAGLPQVFICAPRGAGVPELRAAIAAALMHQPSETPAISARGAALLHSAADHAEQAAVALSACPPAVDAAGDLSRAALSALREYLGEGADASILDFVFANFCIGK